MRSQQVKKCFLICCSILLLCTIRSAAQIPQSVRWYKTRFEGRWVNKKEYRHISIYFDEEDRITINDQTLGPEPSSVDAYRMWPQKGKLISPEDTEHHGAYTEVRRDGERLIFEMRIKDINNKIIPLRTYLTREK